MHGARFKGQGDRRGVCFFCPANLGVPLVLVPADPSREWRVASGKGEEP